MKTIFPIFMLIIVILSSFTLGVAGTILYQEYQQDKQIQQVYDGLYFKEQNMYNWEEARGRAKELDKHGIWVCVNVRHLDYERALNTCKHEVGHEIFARFCEKEDNINKCMELAKYGQM